MSSSSFEKIDQLDVKDRTRSMAESSFEDVIPEHPTFKFNEALVQAIYDESWERPTPEQVKSITNIIKPAFKESKDRKFVVCGATGTGKSAAMIVPSFYYIDPNVKAVQAIIIAPTREIIQQNHELIKVLTKEMDGYKSFVVFKDERPDPDDQPQIIVGTAFAVSKLFSQDVDSKEKSKFDISKIKYVAIDEFDDIIDKRKPHHSSLRRFMKGGIENDCVFAMFSATYPKRLHNYVDELFSKPVIIGEPNEKSEFVSHVLVDARCSNINESLEKAKKSIIQISNKFEIKKGFVYTCNIKTAEDFAKYINESGKYKAICLYGSVEDRDQVLDKFKKEEYHFLVTTHNFSRGLDVPTATHIFCIDIPVFELLRNKRRKFTDLEVYTHLSGRVGRAAQTGYCICFAKRDTDLKRLGYLKRNGFEFREYDLSSDKVDDQQTDKVVEGPDAVADE